MMISNGFEHRSDGFQMKPPPSLQMNYSSADRQSLMSHLKKQVATPSSGSGSAPIHHFVSVGPNGSNSGPSEPPFHNLREINLVAQVPQQPFKRNAQSVEGKLSQGSQH